MAGESCSASEGSRSGGADTQSADRAGEAAAADATDRTADAVAGAEARDAIAENCADALQGAADTLDPNDDPDTVDRAVNGLDAAEEAATEEAVAEAFQPEPPEQSMMQSLRETVATNIGGAIGTAQALGGWVSDMIGGVGAAIETGYEAAVTGIEAATGLIDDAYAEKQRTDLQARADALMESAQELMNDPVGVAEAFAESYEARYAAADALERAYREGYADISALQEAARMRAEATTELGVLGVETGAVAVAGAGAIAKGLRAAQLADRLPGATPLAMAMAATERARMTAQVVDDLVADPGLGQKFTATDVAHGIDTRVARNTPGTATGQGVRIDGDWLRSSITDGTGAPIPDHIADRLAGQSYTSFDAFRESLWREVAADPGLSAQFSQSNIDRMAAGKAPFAPRAQHQGANGVFEIDHIQPLFQGGAVYDIDNLQIMTPRAHSIKSVAERAN